MRMSREEMLEMYKSDSDSENDDWLINSEVEVMDDSSSSTIDSESNDLVIIHYDPVIIDCKEASVGIWESKAVLQKQNDLIAFCCLEYQGYIDSWKHTDSTYSVFKFFWKVASKILFAQEVTYETYKKMYRQNISDYEVGYMEIDVLKLLLLQSDYDDILFLSFVLTEPRVKKILGNSTIQYLSNLLKSCQGLMEACHSKFLLRVEEQRQARLI